MTDQYMDQYKKEITQVHAPMDLIERTKAAVREEERILRERRGQEETFGTAKMRSEQKIMSGTIEMRSEQKIISKAAGYADEKKHAKRFAVRRWAYPLTAAAVFLILVSVSLTMRGIKGERSGMDSAFYEESAEAGAGSLEEAILEADAGASAELTTEGVSADMTVESVEEKMAVELTEDEASMEAEARRAENMESIEESAATSINEVQRSTEVRNQAVGETDDTACDMEKEDAAAAKTDLEKKKEAIVEDFADSALAVDYITIEKVDKKPAFCDLDDTKAHIYKGKTFLVRKEKTGWAAYVDAENGIGYVLRGEIENLDKFLEAGNEKLGQLDMME